MFTIAKLCSLSVYTEQNIPCVFPFIYDGITYNECTTEGGYTGIPYCAVVNNLPTGSNLWGYCNLNGEYINVCHLILQTLDSNIMDPKLNIDMINIIIAHGSGCRGIYIVNQSSLAGGVMEGLRGCES